MMDRQFWLDKWNADEIGFHKDTVHPALAAHLDRLSLSPGARVFLPLCGKTRDIGWLLSRGYRVAGAELSDRAIRDLFADLAIAPTLADHGPLTHYTAPGIDLFGGDIFDLSAADLGPVDAIYDRAALVALPPETRPRYAEHVTGIAAGAPQLLVAFDYDQSAMNGPPFSVEAAQISRYYARDYEITLLASDAVEGGLKGRCPAQETVWLLTRRRG